MNVFLMHFLEQEKSFSRTTARSRGQVQKWPGKINKSREKLKNFVATHLDSEA